MSRKWQRPSGKPRTLTCSACGGPYTLTYDANYSCTCPDCKDRPTVLTPEQFLALLIHIRQRIADGLELRYYDDTTPGDKETHHAWGFCSKDNEQFPDPQAHTWPHNYQTQGRVALLDKPPGCCCPFDRRNEETKDDWTLQIGCFYSCRFFKPEKVKEGKGRNRRTRYVVPTREEALALYDQAIARMQQYGKTIRPTSESSEEAGSPPTAAPS